MLVDFIYCKLLVPCLVHTVIRYQLSELKKDGSAVLTAMNNLSISIIQ